MIKVYGLIIVHLLCFQKHVPSYTFTFLLTCFFPSPQPCLHKPYPQSKTFLNTQAVPSSAVFCSNTVLITTPSSSMQFFSFFVVLPNTPTTTGMALMLLMFHILLISLFSSWDLSIFPSHFF